MKPAYTLSRMDSDTEPAQRETASERTWLRLERERRRIQSEISAYPRPIPACDQQFNHLLEQRAVITRKLQRLREVKSQLSSIEFRPK